MTLSGWTSFMMLQAFSSLFSCVTRGGSHLANRKHNDSSFADSTILVGVRETSFVPSSISGLPD